MIDAVLLVATDKQLRIINVLTEATMPLPLTDIASQANVNRTGVRHLIQRGIKRGIIKIAYQNKKSKYYELKKEKK